MITYEFKGDDKNPKVVFCKDGIYFSLTPEQLKELEDKIRLIRVYGDLVWRDVNFCS